PFQFVLISNNLSSNSGVWCWIWITMQAPWYVLRGMGLAHGGFLLVLFQWFCLFGLRVYQNSIILSYHVGQIKWMICIFFGRFFVIEQSTLAAISNSNSVPFLCGS